MMCILCILYIYNVTMQNVTIVSMHKTITFKTTREVTNGHYYHKPVGQTDL